MTGVPSPVTANKQMFSGRDLPGQDQRTRDRIDDK